jgi:hypothetical protein
VAQKPSKAPFVVFGGMILIGISGLLAVFIYDCQREEPYMDPVEIRPGSPDRVVPRDVEPLEPAPIEPAPPR